MVNLSEFPEYLAAVPAAAAGDLASARSSFALLFARIEAEAGSEQLAFVLLLMADVEAQAGNAEKALSLHERALAIDNSNPLTRLNCAKSLLGRLNNSALALTRLQEAESLLASSAWHPNGQDMPRQWYEQQIQAARQRALAV